MHSFKGREPQQCGFLTRLTGASKELLEQEVKPYIETFLKERGLHLSQEKTVITPIEDGFDFLGQNVRSFGGKIIVTPSKKNIQAFKAKVKEIFAENKAAKQENLIGVLNPVVRGWANYMCFQDFRLDRLMVVVEDMAMGQAETSQQERRLMLAATMSNLPPHWREVRCAVAPLACRSGSVPVRVGAPPATI